MGGLLDGRVALVTGAAQGIGFAIARDLVGHGARVVIADPGTGIDGHGVDPALVKKAEAEIGDNAISFRESIASPSAAEAAVTMAVKRLGGLDIVVNNAAISRPAPIFDLDAGDWEAVIRTNLSAAAFVTRAACIVLRENALRGRGGNPYGWGRIVNIVASVELNHGQAADAAAKAGLVGLTHATAMDMRRYHVTVNAVAPVAATRASDVTEPAAHVAQVVTYLCAPAAQKISGQVLGVRGREVTLLATQQPVARLVRSEDWTVDALSTAIAHEFDGRWTDLGADSGP